MTWKLSLFTVCAPWLPLPELAALASRQGLHGLDLTVRPHAFDPAKPFNFWGNNAATLDLARLGDLAVEARRALDQHQLSCPVLCSYLQASEVDAIRRVADAAKILGAPMVRVWTLGPRPGEARAQVAQAQREWQALAELAREYDLRFVLELHDRTITSSVSGALRLLDGLDPARVGVILDVANVANEGNEPLATGIDLLGPYLAHVQVKDITFTPAKTWNGIQGQFAPLGQGGIDWEHCLRLLRAAGYQGWLALEDFTRIERGPERIVDDAAWLRARIAVVDRVIPVAG